MSLPPKLRAVVALKELIRSNHTRRKLRQPAGLFLASALIALWTGLSVRAQSSQGTVVGSVTDTTGARVVGATISVEASGFKLQRKAISDSQGEFRVSALPAGDYKVSVDAPGFESDVRVIKVGVDAAPTVDVVLSPGSVRASVQVHAGSQATLASQPLETTSSVEKTSIGASDLESRPLAARSFANIAYPAPMTEPVESSDPTKARITAVSFHGSSGLNVDLSVDGGDNNDDYIGGFLQNFSPDSIQEFTARTAQYDADTGHTTGGSVIIITRRGTDLWHGSGAFYYRGKDLNARNALDNPQPNPKQPFSRDNAVFSIGGPVITDRLWVFSSLEYVRENAAVAYSQASLDQFNALASLAAMGIIPGITHIDVPASVEVPFRDWLATTRLDWAQSPRSEWLLRAAIDRNHTANNLIQQGALPSTGALTVSNYASLLASNSFQFTPTWLAELVLQGAGFRLTETRNSHLGEGLAFPFTSTVLATSGLETLGDNQFVTGIANFPVLRMQQKYQVRYDVTHSGGQRSPRFGVNFINEPVLGGALAANQEIFAQLPHDPTFYLAQPGQFVTDFNQVAEFIPAADGGFSQSVRRLGLYAQDSWRPTSSLTLNYGLRYDTPFGLFRAEGRGQDQNSAVFTLNQLGIPLSPGIPHDYRKAIAPRLGLAYSPSPASRTVIRAGAGLYYSDLAQNGWVQAFQAVNSVPATGPVVLSPRNHGFVIDPSYRTPYAFQASFGFEKALATSWHLDVHFEHVKGVHQYRRYEYVSGITLPADAPDISVFRTDNRSRYDGATFLVSHQFANRFDMSVHYTLASAATWGGTVGELFDYVNGVADVRNAFGPGDYGPSGEDVRHRLVVSATLRLPLNLEVSTLSQFESARPFTLTTPLDINRDGIANDRAVVNGVQTSLDEFRGTPYYQVDLRVTRNTRLGDRGRASFFVEFFNLFNRANPGNNYVTSVAALPVPPTELANVQHICLDAACTQLAPIASLNQLKVPAGALGDFFGLGTTVGLPFAAQLGVRISF